jgi:hypothetical protein
MHEHDDYDASSGNGDYVEVSSEGESYQLDAEYDLDHDGVDDSAVVGHADGSSTTYSDTDGDGDADFQVTVDGHGHVTDQERHDEGTDTWVGMNGHADGDVGHTGDTAAHVDSASHTDTSSDHVMVDTGRGEVDAGEARYDLDGDGVNDTAVVTDEDGDRMYLTDVDGDGSADVATEVDADGNVVVYTESGADGDWEVAEAGHVDAQGNLDVDYTAR